MDGAELALALSISRAASIAAPTACAELSEPTPDAAYASVELAELATLAARVDGTVCSTPFPPRGVTNEEVPGNPAVPGSGLEGAFGALNCAVLVCSLADTSHNISGRKPGKSSSTKMDSGATGSASVGSCNASH